MERSCSVEGCDRKYRARGFCIGHYNAALKKGEIELIKPRRKDDLCSRCRERPQASRGTNSYCKECHAEYNRERYQKMSDEDRAALNLRLKKVREDDPKRFKGYRLKKYGLTLESYEEMLDEQGGTCAICTYTPEEGEWLHVDHDHSCCPQKLQSCGKCVRGLLCSNCNNGLGRFKDNVDLLRSATNYLTKDANQSSL